MYAKTWPQREGRARFLSLAEACREDVVGYPAGQWSRSVSRLSYDTTAYLGLYAFCGGWRGHVVICPVADVARRDISAQFTPTLYEYGRLRSAISSNRLPLACPGYLDDGIHMAISEALVLSPLLYSTFLSCEWISRPGMDTVCLHA